MKPTEADIVPSVQRIPTKPVEYAKQLARILVNNPHMDVADLARRIEKTKEWVEDRLGLLKLISEIQKKVDNFEIDLQKAITLSRLSPKEQKEWTQRNSNVSLKMPEQKLGKSESGF